MRFESLLFLFLSWVGRRFSHLHSIFLFNFGWVTGFGLGALVGTEHFASTPHGQRWVSNFGLGFFGLQNGGRWNHHGYWMDTGTWIMDIGLVYGKGLGHNSTWAALFEAIPFVWHFIGASFGLGAGRPGWDTQLRYHWV